MGDPEREPGAPETIRQEQGGVVIQDQANVQAGDIVGHDKNTWVYQISVNLADLVRPIWARLARWQTLALLSMVVGALVGVQWWRSRPPILTAGFNVVVARIRPYESGNPKAHAAADEIQSQLLRTLDEQLTHSPLQNHEVRPIPRTVAGDDEARRLARQTHADLVVYGELAPPDATGPGRFYPKFYINEDLDADADIVGTSSLGAMISFADYATLLNRELPARIQTLADFTVGIAELVGSHKDYAAANRSFTHAQQSFPADTVRGREVISYFQGWALQGTGDAIGAAKMYSDALRLQTDEPYLRSYLGLGSLEIAAYRATKAPHIRRPAQLDDAIGYFQRVLSDGRAPPYIAQRAQWNIASTYWLKATELAAPELYQQAITPWQSMVDDFEAGQHTGLAALWDRVTGESEPGWRHTLAGQTYLQLGHAYLGRAIVATGSSPASRQADLERAAAAYNRVPALLSDPEARWRASIGLGETHLRRALLGDRAYYARAVEHFRNLVARPDDLKVPGVPDAAARTYFLLGEAYRGQGQPEQARQAYLKCLELAAADTLRGQAQDRLKSLSPAEEGSHATP